MFYKTENNNYSLFCSRIVPTIMGERVTIKQYSNSSRTNLIGQKIVYYYYLNFRTPKKTLKA